MNYKAEIQRLQQLAEEQEQEARERAKEIWQQIVSNQDNFEWTATAVGFVKPNIFTRYAGRPYVFISKRLKPHVLEAWRERPVHVSLSNDYMDGRWQGMKYVLTDEGILTHEGGGTLVLDDPKLCSDAEWQELCSGRVPAKFIR